MSNASGLAPFAVIAVIAVSAVITVVEYRRPAASGVVAQYGASQKPLDLIPILLR